jgi:hypothetical protein
VLTYEWRLTFGDISTYLNQDQLAACYSKWNQTSLPSDPERLLIWIDVLFEKKVFENKDQTLHV